jgi:hypothetical protein
VFYAKEQKVQPSDKPGHANVKYVKANNDALPSRPSPIRRAPRPRRCVSLSSMYLPLAPKLPPHSRRNPAIFPRPCTLAFVTRRMPGALSRRREEGGAGGCSLELHGEGSERCWLLVSVCLLLPPVPPAQSPQGAGPHGCSRNACYPPAAALAYIRRPSKPPAPAPTPSLRAAAGLLCRRLLLLVPHGSGVDQPLELALLR